MQEQSPVTSYSHQILLDLLLIKLRQNERHIRMRQMILERLKAHRFRLRKPQPQQIMVFFERPLPEIPVHPVELLFLCGVHLAQIEQMLHPDLGEVVRRQRERHIRHGIVLIRKIPEIRINLPDVALPSGQLPKRVITESAQQKDGDLYDTWDSSGEVPQFYWYRKEKEECINNLKLPLQVKN